MQRFKLHAEGAAKTKHTHCALKSYCTPVVLHSEMMGCLVAVSHRHHQLVVHVTDMVFVSSVCTPHALALGMVFSNVSHCVARSHSIIYDPPPTLQHWLSRCLNMLCIPRPSVNKHREMNCLPFTALISFVSRCSLVHRYQTAFSLFEYIWNACLPLDDIQGGGNSLCICVPKMCVGTDLWENWKRITLKANRAFTKNLSVGLWWCKNIETEWKKVTIWIEP